MPSIWKLAPAIDHSLAKPASAVRLGRAQLAHLDTDEGVPLLHALVAIEPGLAPEADELALWPSLVRESAIRHVLDMPGGRRRIEAMLGLARFLPEANREEALAGILDGTAPQSEGPIGYHQLHETFVKTLDAPRKERWVEHRVALFANDELFSEMLARKRADAWPAETVDRCWRSLKSQRSASGSLPSTSISLYRALPAALREEALAILRAHATQEERRYAFPFFDAAELSEDEREDTVAVPWNPNTREDDRTFADHLGRVSHLFTSVSATLRRRTVERALALPHPYDRHVALIHLVPVAEDVDRARIVPELARLTLDQAHWPTAKRNFAIFDDETMVRLVAHTAMQTCGWLLEELIRHAHGRGAASGDAICEAAIDNVSALSAQDDDEPLCALSPWMARRSAREIPRSIARRLTR